MRSSISRGLTLGEEVGVPLDQLAVHGRGRQSSKLFHLLLLVCRGLHDIHCDLLDLVDGHRAGSPQALDDRLRTDTLLNQFANLLQYFTGEDHHRRRTVSDFGILGPGDIRQDAGGGVHNIEELKTEGYQLFVPCISPTPGVPPKPHVPSLPWRHRW